MDERLLQYIRQGQRPQRMGGMATAIGFGLFLVPSLAGALFVDDPFILLMLAAVLVIPVVLGVLTWWKNRDPFVTPLGIAIATGGKGLSAFYPTTARVTFAGVQVDTMVQICFDMQKGDTEAWLVKEEDVPSIMALLRQAMPAVATQPLSRV